VGIVDLLLAILHHLLVFSLAAILAAEALLLMGEVAGSRLGRLAAIDGFYGMNAGLVILVGIARVVFGLKGWEFYVYNWSFWAKMAAFAGVALLSIVPTRRILSWSRKAAGTPDFSAPAAELASVRRFIRAQMIVFTLIPVFAAMMARGYGY
jgi:putative membrane protein